MSNPLLEKHALPPFSRIEPQHVEPAIRSLIERNRTRIGELLAATDTYTWSNLLAPIEELEDELAQAWSPVSHLNSVQNSEQLRAAYNACLPLLSEYATWTGQHSALCSAYQQIADGDEWGHLDDAQRKTLDNALRDFRLAGVALPAAEKARYGELQKQLSELGSRFGENVLDATKAWSKSVSREQLEGLPETALANAHQAAEQAGEEGYLINLEFPSYLPVQTYCHDRALREEVYTAFCTRASDQGPNAGRWDNGPLIDGILASRLELAQLLEFENYAELSLARKMAPSSQHVMAFLLELADQTRAQGEQEWQALLDFAKERNGPDELQAWDVAYYAEQMRQARYNISQEDIRPYLPVSRVLPGLFEVVRRLFGVEVRECERFDSYHPSVRLFDVLEGDKVIARFYLDLYARADKRGGAWMDDCRVRRVTAEGLQIPVAYLVCNFTPPVGDAPSLLTHTELTTLFHEFGHGLHHMLTRQTVAPVSGINGVAWDAVELPSQFLEN
ncbi:MAG: M3 family metallopeptidase, partial [Halioglobus sp.]|nr:M3 family metallopeptidase [Halioglobus sp.]